MLPYHLLNDYHHFVLILGLYIVHVHYVRTMLLPVLIMFIYNIQQLISVYRVSETFYCDVLHQTLVIS